MMPGVVFDCMVFLQGAARPAGPARACFDLVDESRVELFLSAEIVTEIRDVLTRPKTLRKFPLLTPEWVDTFLHAVVSRALAIANVPTIERLERDPKDEPYLNLAIAAQAKYLVSRDRDLLDLMADQAFRERHPGLLILDPVEFLKELERMEAPRQAHPHGTAEENRLKTDTDDEIPRA